MKCGECEHRNDEGYGGDPGGLKSKHTYCELRDVERHLDQVACAPMQETERLRSRIKLMRLALRKMMQTHGMHGPCDNHNCSDCDAAYNQARKALEKL